MTSSPAALTGTVVADVSRIAAELGWRAQHDLDDTVASVFATRV